MTAIRPSTAGSPPRAVAALLVTHNRHEVLQETLDAIFAQTRPPDSVLVVDNASSDSTASRLARDQRVRCLPLTDNLGPAGGFAAGFEALHGDAFDWYWLLDDDSVPNEHALERLCAALAARPTAAAIGGRGGVVRFGYIRHVSDPTRARLRALGHGLYAVDFVLNDGALISDRLVDAVGVPRRDLFIMMEDVEYTLRAHRAGLEIVLLDAVLLQPKHLGATGGDGGSPVWRGYYQSRNQVRIAIDSRSPLMLAGCAVRQARLLTADARRKDRRRERMQLRVRGIRDGITGRMGRTVEPAAFRPHP